MNRRRVLRSVGVAATISLSGCVETLQEHYQGSFRGLVPVEIYSEADQYYNLTLEAYDPETNQQTYDESYTITAGQSATSPHLNATEQLFRATKLGQDNERLAVSEGTITPSTTLVVVRIPDDGLKLDIQREDGAGSGPASEAGTGSLETAGSTSFDGDVNDSETTGYMADADTNDATADSNTD